jgi:glycosyltransferase involved in cell wall biosynthesis
MKRRLRICYIIDALTRAGTESQLLALIRSLDRRRFAPSLVLLHGDDDLSRELSPRDCPVLPLQLRSLGSRQSARAAASLSRHLRQERIDIVQTYFLDSTYFGVPVARLNGIRRVLRVRNNLGHWLTPRHRVLGQIMGRLVDATLTNCEPARQAVLDAEGGQARKVVVLENGVDVERFQSIESPRMPIRHVGAIANLRPVKGVDLLIRAATKLVSRHPNLQFHVAGEGPQRPDLERMIAESGLTDRFHLRGAIADIPAFLGSLDMVVVPSLAEGMSNAVLESMAAGRPIVATDVGANRRLLDEGQCGQLVPAGDVDALARGMEQLLTNAVLSEQLADRARRRARTVYSREAMIARFEQFYERLCAGRAA